MAAITGIAVMGCFGNDWPFSGLILCSGDDRCRIGVRPERWPTRLVIESGTPGSLVVPTPMVTCEPKLLKAHLGWISTCLVRVDH